MHNCPAYLVDLFLDFPVKVVVGTFNYISLCDVFINLLLITVWQTRIFDYKIVKIRKLREKMFHAGFRKRNWAPESEFANN